MPQNYSMKVVKIYEKNLQDLHWQEKQLNIPMNLQHFNKLGITLILENRKDGALRLEKSFMT